MNRKKIPQISLALLLVSLALAVAACTGRAASGASSARAVSGTPTVDILYLHHPPVLPVLANVESVLKAYGDKVSVSRYDFDTPEGEAFAKKKNLTGHTPIVIYINGASTVTLDGRKVTFQSFPKGEGTGMIPDGDWSMADLAAALKAAAANE